MSNQTEMPVTIKLEWCKGCGICLEYCPKNVYDWDGMGKVKVSRPEDCIKCGLCEIRCPEIAIVVKKEDETK